MEDKQKIGIPKVILLTFALFNLVGLWTKEDEISISIRQYFRFAYFLLFILSVSLEAFLVESSDESVLLTVITLVAIVQVTRMYCLIWRQKEITKMTQETGVYSVDDSEVFSSATNKLRNGTTLLKVFDGCVALALATVIVTPLVTGHLIFNIAFPLDYVNNRASFYMAYAFFTLRSALSVVCCLFAPIVWYLMTNLIIKYHRLGSQFKSLFRRKAKNPGREIPSGKQNGLFLKQFVEAVKTHEETYDAVEQFALTFSSVFLLQIVNSSICICGPIYTLAFSNHEHLFKDMFYSTLLFYCSADIFMVMYLGNEIKLSSDSLSFCLYESDWIGQTDSCKLLLLIVVERLKIQQQLTVGKLFPLNLESFNLIVHRAYSMFNILLNFRN